MRKILSILMKRNRATYRALPLEMKRQARKLLWEHAKMIEATHDEDEWCRQWRVRKPERDRKGRFTKRR